MTTISIDNQVKEALLKEASKLQIKLGRKMDYNETLKVILSEREGRRLDLFLRACSPVEGLEGAEKELHEERRRDEEILERNLRG